jgi:hypothetical protein
MLLNILEWRGYSGLFSESDLLTGIHVRGRQKGWTQKKRLEDVTYKGDIMSNCFINFSVKGVEVSVHNFEFS